MPCQLMVGFIAHAKSFDIQVDKNELEGFSCSSHFHIHSILSHSYHTVSFLLLSSSIILFQLFLVNPLTFRCPVVQQGGCG